MLFKSVKHDLSIRTLAWGSWRRPLQVGFHGILTHLVSREDGKLQASSHPRAIVPLLLGQAVYFAIVEEQMAGMRCGMDMDTHLCWSFSRGPVLRAGVELSEAEYQDWPGPAMSPANLAIAMQYFIARAQLDAELPFRGAVKAQSAWGPFLVEFVQLTTSSFALRWDPGFVRRVFHDATRGLHGVTFHA